MKRPPTWMLMLGLCLLFLAFGVGYCLGRGSTEDMVRLTLTRENVPESLRLQGAAEETAPSSGEDSLPARQTRLNLNTAAEEELETLPGIGRTLARRIVEYRQKNGNFMAAEELLEIEGIGERIFEGLKDYVTVEDTQ